MASATAHSMPSPTSSIIFFKGTVSKERFDLYLNGLHHGALVALVHLHHHFVRNMMWDPGSGIQKKSIPDPEPRGQKGTRSPLLKSQKGSILLSLKGTVSEEFIFSSFFILMTSTTAHSPHTSTPLSFCLCKRQSQEKEFFHSAPCPAFTCTANLPGPSAIV
jgi:hypothetical protein